MFKIIGADQREYGPVSTDQLRQWIAEGRVNGQTMVQREGAPNWQPLASVPEFAGLFHAAPPTGGIQGTNATAQVQGPAIGLLVTAVLGFLAQIVSILQIVLAGAGGPFQRRPTGNPTLDQFMTMTSGGTGVTLGIIGLVIAIVIFIGALKMKSLQSYSLAVTSAILAIVPCISPCCCIGIPIGIWAVMVLMRPEVKAAFK